MLELRETEFREHAITGGYFWKKMNHWQRDIEQLREVASLFWPEELSGEAAKLSVIPILLNTQKQFLGILGIKISDIHKFFKLIELAELPANLFLKHLMILADFGGELLQRVNDNFSVLFPSGELEYALNGVPQRYRFQKLPIKGRLTNDRTECQRQKTGCFPSTGRFVKRCDCSSDVRE